MKIQKDGNQGWFVLLRSRAERELAATTVSNDKQVRDRNGSLIKVGPFGNHDGARDTCNLLKSQRTK